MIEFLCGLTGAQWARVHNTPPTGTTPHTPEGYTRSGLYEGRDTFWLIQRAGGVYRYWNYSDVLRPPVNGTTYDEMLDVAVKARHEAHQLRERAEHLHDMADQLDQIAANTLNEALIGDE